MVYLAALAVALLAIFATAAWLALRRQTLSVSLQATASEEGDWALAAGGSVGPLAMSAARMHLGMGAWELHLFGRRVARRTRRPGAPKSAMSSAMTRRALAIDPILLADLGLDLFRRVRVQELRAKVRAGLTDPLLQARVAGVLAVLGGVLAPVVEIDHGLDWGAEKDSLDMDLSFAGSFVPLAVFIDMSAFAIRQGRVFFTGRFFRRST